MTVDVASRRTRRTTKVAGEEPRPPMISESLSIGEIEQTVFSCPNCQRPLAMGARKCPGCKTHLVAGVKLTKASGFVAVGLAIGLAIAGAAAGVGALSNTFARDAEVHARVAAARAAAEAANPQPLATAAALATARPLATAAPVEGTGIPPLTKSALVQAANVNAQLAAAVPVLQSALAAKT